MSRFASYLALAAACAALAPALGAAPEPGLAYVHTARGTPTLAGAPLARGQTFAFAKQEVVVAADEPLVLVLSNGLALSAPVGGRFALEEFQQEPIVDTSLERDFEPARVALTFTLTEGTLAFAGRIPKPTSDFIIKTPLAELKCVGRRFAVTYADGKLSVAVVEGTVFVNIPATGYSGALQSRQTAVLTAASQRSQFPLDIGFVGEAQQRELDRWIGMGAWAEARVDFTRGGGVIRPRLVLPQGFTRQLSADEPRFRQ